MAGSRLNKLGSIFERVTGLLESGAYKTADKPIWYDLYARYPPKYEPRFDRKAPDTEVKQIFYEEDLIRAKIHATKRLKYYNFHSKAPLTQTQLLIKECEKIMKDKGVSIDEAVKMMSATGEERKETGIAEPKIENVPDKTEVVQ